MEKVYREMLDVIRAEIAELYRLRRSDAERLSRLERTTRREPAARHHGDGIAQHRPAPGGADTSRT